MSITLLCSGCFAPLMGVNSGPILVSPCQNVECPFYVRLPQIETMLGDMDISMLIDPALFPENQQPPPSTCPYPELKSPQSPSPFLNCPQSPLPSAKSPQSPPTSDSITVALGSPLMELDETSRPVTSTTSIAPTPQPSSVSHEQLSFVKMQGSSIHIKRPANSFMLYRSDKIKALKAANPRAKATSEFTQTLAKSWKQESTSVKEKYAQRASDLAGLHARNFPDYKYAPRRNCK